MSLVQKIHLKLMIFQEENSNNLELQENSKMGMVRV